MNFKNREFSIQEELTESQEEYDQELEAMLSDAAWDLNARDTADEERGKVICMEMPSREELERMGESAIARNMEALRDDYKDKGFSDLETDIAIVSDYEEAREEFYSDLNEGLDLNEE